MSKLAQKATAKKACTYCKKTKSVKEFNLRKKDNPLEFHNQCRDCQKSMKMSRRAVLEKAGIRKPIVIKEAMKMLGYTNKELFDSGFKRVDIGLGKRTHVRLCAAEIEEFLQATTPVDEREPTSTDDLEHMVMGDAHVEATTQGRNIVKLINAEREHAVLLYVMEHEDMGEAHPVLVSAGLDRLRALLDEIGDARQVLGLTRSDWDGSHNTSVATRGTTGSRVGADG